MKSFDSFEMLWINVFAESLFALTAIRYDRLEHSSHHIELKK